MCRRVIEDSKKIYRREIEARKMKGSNHSVGILKEYGKSMLRVCLEYAKSILKVCFGYTSSFSCSINGALRLAVMVVVMEASTMRMWGQTTGLYYIANNNDKEPYYSTSTVSTNYYLVPASNGGDANIAINRWAWNDDAATPFVTTYKTNKDNNSIWIIKESETNGEYYLIHVLSGKYMTRNNGVGSNSNRRVFHMENPSTLGNDHLFNFTTHTGTLNFYSIKPKSLSSGHCFLNPSKANKDFYCADPDNQEGGYYIGGLIGTYNKNAANDKGSKWFLETAPKFDEPTMTVNTGNRTFTITADLLPPNCSIRYTTGDGTQAAPDLSAEDPSGYSGELYDPLDPPTITDFTNVKAVVVGYGMVLSQIASTTVKCTPPSISYDNVSTVTMTPTTEGSAIYYTTDENGAPSTLYESPISVTNGQTIKAIAKKDGCVDSEVITYIVRQACATPVISITYNNDGTATIGITTGTDGATIHYTTDGTDPDENSAIYPGLFANPVSTGMTIKAISVKDNYNNSSVEEATVLQVAQPNIAVVNNEITITCGTEGAAIYYSVDGGSPTPYTSALGLAANVSGRSITAYATKNQMVKSANAMATANQTKLKLPTPTISIPDTYNENGNVQFSINVNITDQVVYKYTLDGSTDPSTSVITCTGLFTLNNPAIIKVIATNEHYENSEVYTSASLIMPTNLPLLIQSQNNAWNTTDFHFYMIPGDEESSIIKVNTTSLFRPTMEWYFLNAEDGYYYIVNNSAKDNSNNPYYLCYDGTNVCMLTYDSSNANKFKFRIIESPTSGSFNILPYGETKKFINKGSNNGNAAADVIGLRTENTTYSNNANARWIFVASSTLDKTAPFTVSDAASTSYYKITSVGSNGYYIIPGAPATTSNSSDDAVLKSGIWYFEVAQAASSSDWCTYYHIRNAVTGDYLYFTKDANNAGACLATSNTITVGSENRYMFTWAKTADANVNYYIIPKNLKDISQNQFSSLQRNNGTLQTNVTRGAGNYAWTFTTSSYTCAQPVITWSDSDGGYVITASEPDADMYYLIGDGELTPSTGTLYSGAIPVAELPGTTATIKAITARNSDGSDKSSVASATVSKVASPVISLTDDGKVQITCETEGASIYYEIGNTAEVSTPTSGSNQYTTPIDNTAGKYIKAIAVKGGLINSTVTASEQIVFSCAKPVIRKATATTFTIECSFPSSGVTIYYTTDGSTPSTSSQAYGGAATFNISDLPFTVKAIAVATNYNNSAIAERIISESLDLDDDGYYEIASDNDFSKFIMMANGEGSNEKYKITVDINALGADAITIPFTGELKGVAKADGTFPVISNLSHPLFNTVNGGTVKNIMLDNVQISQSGNVGAIASLTSGYSRIYNCGILPSANGSTIASTTTSGDDTGYCGGLVGWLKDDSRVINCFSYANITGGNDVAGIVGHNEIASTAAVTDGKYADLRTAVVNCMFYGNITGGSQRYPVYGGEKIVNNTATGINNYDFYRAEASVGTLADYNCSWPAKEEYLTRYEFYRNLLNSNRELCGWWVGATSAPSTMTTTDVQAVAKDASLMAKWVLDTEIAPYPILKKFDKYTSTVNIDADASWRTTANEWEGKKMGTLKVTINPGTHAAGGASTKSNVDFTITDMDTLRGDYCYKKIQLPYYNTVFGNPNGNTWTAKYGGNYGDYVVIGWKVSTSEGTVGTLTENWETGYNFADRNCTAKDANRVFAQGGYYYVPNGVENITITAQWASAVYLDNTDHYYDHISVSSFTVSGGVSIGTSTLQPFAPAGTRSALGNGKTVNNGTISSNMPSGNVYGNAIVLVGNHQEFAGASDIGSANSGCTIMSADFDFDNEPDNCLIWQLGQNVTRQSFYPIRFDFLPIVEMGLAMKEDGSTQYYSLGCFRPLGHFEVTETSLIHFGQFEFSNKNRSANAVAPIILNGGIFDQYTKGTNNNAKTTAEDPINYIIIGGNVRIPSFTPGAHVNNNAKFPTRHCAINVIGGIIDNLYLTGNYNDGVTPNTDNPHCYIDGGRLKQVAAAGKEGINGDVYFKINHSKIWEFYGGSTMDQSSGDNFKIVKGNINVTIDNSIVTKYCGGPKFGDMNLDEDNPANNKTITTNANNTIFTVYYGGGNGGTSYVQYDKTDGEKTVSSNFDWGGTGQLNNYTASNYRDEATGYMADYDMEIVNLSTGTNQNRAVYRTYFYAAQFSATNTGSITNNLTDCTVLTNFYGGGNLGGVVGNVTSTLDGTTHVRGSAYGAGFSATVPDVTIQNKDKVAPTIDVNTGIITPESGGTSTTYTWTHESTLGGQNLSTSNRTVTVDGKNYFYTEKSLDNLGAVSGVVTLTIKGNSIIGTEGDATTGNVYGGGDASGVINTTTPANASTTVNLQGNAEVLGNVFGGGNRGIVSGSTTVNIME